MKFKNRANKCHEVIEGDKKRLVWESRSVAVNCVIILYNIKGEPFVLVSKRGPKAADYQGKLNIVAGYLDWDESGTEAVFRETWEECGLNLPALMNRIFSTVLNDHLSQPWHVKSEPDENRQNISLRYGIAIAYKSNELPPLSLEHNEIVGEVEKAWWMRISDINNHSWAFNHGQVIKDYLKMINKNKV
jgi:NADH pyrophosphatase NudC (nudix superfamily)